MMMECRVCHQLQMTSQVVALPLTETYLFDRETSATRILLQWRMKSQHKQIVQTAKNVSIISTEQTTQQPKASQRNQILVRPSVQQVNDCFAQTNTIFVRTFFRMDPDPPHAASMKPRLFPNYVKLSFTKTHSDCCIQWKTSTTN